MISKPGLFSLLLAGVAAYGVYRYSKLSEEEKRDLKEKGKKFFDDNIPQPLRNMFGGNKTAEPRSSYEYE